MKRIIYYLPMLHVMTLLLAGCGQTKDPHKLSVIPATGVLTIPEMDTAGLSLLFVPDDIKLTNAWCRVDKDGRFTVSTYHPGDGIAVGNYTVLISDGAGVMPGDDTRLVRVPVKYRHQETSPWKVEISPDPQQNVLNLIVQ